MNRSSLLVTLALMLPACAPSMHATSFRQADPKPSADEVQVYTEGAPDRPYEELGVLEVSASALSNSRYGDLIQRARARAAQMGADAIIVTRDPQSRTQGFAYVPPSRKGRGQLVSASGGTIETPRIQVAAIIWRASVRRVDSTSADAAMR
jgi:hypothetical protein